MERSINMRICVYGAASDTIDAEYISTVEKFGKEMAKRGHSLVFGAGKNGLMGASARGVKDGGGHILGVIPEFFFETDAEIMYENCDEVIKTNTMRERKQIMEENADAFVVVPGGIGTYEEFFEILTAKQLLRHDKAIVIYNILGFYDLLNEAFLSAVEKNFINESCKELFAIKNTASEVLDYLEEYEGHNKTLKELKNG